MGRLKTEIMKTEKRMSLAQTGRSQADKIVDMLLDKVRPSFAHIQFYVKKSMLIAYEQGVRDTLSWVREFNEAHTPHTDAVVHQPAPTPEYTSPSLESNRETS